MSDKKRSLYLVNPPFQMRLIAWMMGLSLAPICAFFAAHHYFFWKLRSLGQGINLESNHIYFRFLEAQSQNMFWIFLLCSTLAILVVFILGLVLSHRVAGPIHRMKTHLVKVSEGGEVTELTFRKDDFFSELPRIVNDAVKARKS